LFARHSFGKRPKGKNGFMFPKKVLTLYLRCAIRHSPMKNMFVKKYVLSLCFLFSFSSLVLAGTAEKTLEGWIDYWDGIPQIWTALKSDSERISLSAKRGIVSYFSVDHKFPFRIDINSSTFNGQLADLGINFFLQGEKNLERVRSIIKEKNIDVSDLRFLERTIETRSLWYWDDLHFDPNKNTYMLRFSSIGHGTDLMLEFASKILDPKSAAAFGDSMRWLTNRAVRAATNSTHRPQVNAKTGGKFREVSWWEIWQQLANVLNVNPLAAEALISLNATDRDKHKQTYQQFGLLDKFGRIHSPVLTMAHKCYHYDQKRVIHLRALAECWAFAKRNLLK
jgi:hypothetical protein